MHQSDMAWRRCVFAGSEYRKCALMAPGQYRIQLASRLGIFMFLLFVSHIPAIQSIVLPLSWLLVVTMTVWPSGTELRWN